MHIGGSESSWCKTGNSHRHRLDIHSVYIAHQDYPWLRAKVGVVASRTKDALRLQFRCKRLTKNSQPIGLQRKEKGRKAIWFELGSRNG